MPPEASINKQLMIAINDEPVGSNDNCSFHHLSFASSMGMLSEGLLVL
jgi:hypothetical protein